MTDSIDIESIKIEGRHRKDLGDLKKLADSMRDLGLLQPVAVDGNGVLVFGERRLAAARSLGWERIPANVVDTYGDRLRALRMERDENTERKAMTASELVALDEALEKSRKEELKERRRVAGRAGGKASAAARDRSPTIPSTEGIVEVESPRARNRRAEHAEALGVSEGHLYRARTVVKAAQDPERPSAERARAKQLVEDMDAGRVSVSGAYERLNATIKPRTRGLKSMSDPGEQRNAIRTAVGKLAGMVVAFDQVDELHSDITTEEAAEWAVGLSRSRASISKLIKKLKERSSGSD